jgi:hypothetical protein
LPPDVGADVAGPLGLRQVAAGAKAKGGDQLLLADKPHLDLAVLAAARQSGIARGAERDRLQDSGKLIWLVASAIDMVGAVAKI